MENIIINDCNLNNKDVSILSTSVRAVLFDNDNILVERHVDGSIILPGSFFNCPAKELLIKDLAIKLGVSYDESDLTKFLFLNHYQSNYNLDDSINIPRLVEVDYFFGRFRGIDYVKSLKENNYSLKLINLDDLIKMTSGSFENDIVNFNNRETNEALKVYKKVNK